MTKQNIYKIYRYCSYGEDTSWESARTVVRQELRSSGQPAVKFKI